MSKMSTDLVRVALNGPTMGTRWSALLYLPEGTGTAPLSAALQAAVERVDAQMSLWRAGSDLNRLNAAPVGEWVALGAEIGEVLHLGLTIGRASGGAFDLTLGDAVRAWGFGPEGASEAAIGAARTAARRPAWETVELDRAGARARRLAPVSLDLNGIAKGYGADCLARALKAAGVTAGLVGIDGEMRALGRRPDGAGWTIAVEAPEVGRRTPHSMLVLEEAAVATSGDYRHFVEVQGRALAHTMDPRRGMPLLAAPASVTVVAQSCAAADAWATALMVAGPEAGLDLARRAGLEALFLLRGADGNLAEARGVGRLFGAAAA
ncbi:thiamine biosynthesis protein ApbE [Rhodobacter xanthinilyticus]|uniref:FAD:protein FMN transferase n=1 Tax=Rhodobacter xanthinilyticus TaxID=1850250 RepID=A0A1D9MBE1_9RHOB|nr:FAD:protein FMN transferase [Rhodobacter xanthinilyticus]AOZ69157.1 thiamine biosynthesis protein ApbE [Rhodobacter xanthinilyticus]